MGYLDAWYDPVLEVRLEDTPAHITQDELERLHRLHAIANAAGAMPRRLGPDATPEELAADKRRAKRLTHAAGQLIAAWGGQVGGGSLSDISRAAAQVNWDRWWESHYVYLLGRRRYIATWALKGNQHEKWARSAVVRLSNEINWLGYALRP